MTDSKELHEPFLKELKALLKKYDAEINMEDLGESWFDRMQMVVDFDGNEQRYYSQLILGFYIDGDE